MKGSSTDSYVNPEPKLVHLGDCSLNSAPCLGGNEVRRIFSMTLFTVSY
jgi:hypothetical protein